MELDKTEEKGPRVNLASHLLRDAYSKRFEIAVLSANLRTIRTWLSGYGPSLKNWVRLRAS